jgi:hypothetical protein
VKMQFKHKKITVSLLGALYGVGIPIVFRDYFIWLATTPQGQIRMVDALPIAGWMIGAYLVISVIVAVVGHK